jgi:hypothetical protein
VSASDETADPGPESVESPAPVETPVATISQHDEWHLVRYGSWEISVGPDGVLRLPGYLHPREVADFIAAATAAAELGVHLAAAFAAALEAGDKTPVPSGVVITERGSPPPGGTVSLAAVPRSVIGRPRTVPRRVS